MINDYARNTLDGSTPVLFAFTTVLQQSICVFFTLVVGSVYPLTYVSTYGVTTIDATTTPYIIVTTDSPLRLS